VIRETHISGPTRVRRFLSRFMVVIVVAVAIEGLVATFKAIRENLELLPHAASILAAVGLLLAGWGGVHPLQSLRRRARTGGDETSQARGPQAGISQPSCMPTSRLLPMNAARLSSKR
jgi:hypothetical protein